ncbi:MAG TPA: ABC transporter ATP-binding protein [Clostridiaceae bacterium]|nr:ABC transporter ATP-binding protein [Clostridiaceae bacterium]
MLEVKNINVFYDQVQAIHDVSFEVKSDEIVSVIGTNGAGKSTLMQTIVSLVETKSGSIIFNGEDITNLPSHDIVKRGIIYVPEGRRIFYDLTVAENLEMGAYALKTDKKRLREDLEMVHEMFPQLNDRMKQLGGTLSGGEQQMLAIARGLMGHPKLLMLDEPSLGLAPVIVEEVFDIILKIKKETNTPIVLVEQNANMAMAISDNTYVLEVGYVSFSGKSSELMYNPEVKEAYLGS